MFVYGSAQENLAAVLEDVKKRIGKDGSSQRWEWYAFPQVWGSTALGFGGIGGQAITTAQTYVIVFRGDVYVYFTSRFAYKLVQLPRQKLEEYLTARRFPSLREVDNDNI